MFPVDLNVGNEDILSSIEIEKLLMSYDGSLYHC